MFFIFQRAVKLHTASRPLYHQIKYSHKTIKKMRKVQMILMLALFSIFTANCNKKDEVKPSVKALLTDKTWKLTAETVSPAIIIAGMSISDLFAGYSDCSKSKSLRFESSGIYRFIPTNCPAAVTARQGTWTLSTDEKKITVVEGGTFEITIVSIDAKTLKFTYFNDFGSGQTGTITSTYTAQ